ncbi:alpha/beta fold hydrolase [Nocardia carnea]|uniref:alpha/beta fold hydrolase n=1 Tax=Nocardia carnea TaxID=37328 RepID=UPI002457B2F9|nr:alpha/beta fold hydrolase [Nocardia carnea]
MNSALTAESTSKTIVVDGLECHYHEAGDGPALIMLHGSGPGVSAWSNFRTNIGFFAEHFRVVMPDLPGFGRSALPDLTEVYSLAAARWVVRLLDALDIESAVFVGNSMGGAVAAELAALAPHRIRRMAIMGSGGMSTGIFQAEPSEGFQRLWAFLANPDRDRMVAWIHTMVHDKSMITDELVDERMRNAMADGVVDRTKRILGAMADPELRKSYVPLWTRAHTIDVPTLMLWGRDDRMLPYDQAHFANRRLPNVELHTFSECGHWIQVEQKAAFERVVLEYLTREGAGKRAG